MPVQIVSGTVDTFVLNIQGADDAGTIQRVVLGTTSSVLDHDNVTNINTGYAAWHSTVLTSAKQTVDLPSIDADTVATISLSRFLQSSDLSGLLTPVTGLNFITPQFFDNKLASDYKAAFKTKTSKYTYTVSTPLTSYLLSIQAKVERFDGQSYLTQKTFSTASTRVSVGLLGTKIGINSAKATFSKINSLNEAAFQPTQDNLIKALAAKHIITSTQETSYEKMKLSQFAKLVGD